MGVKSAGQTTPGDMAIAAIASPAIAARNLGTVFHNNRAESLYLIGWSAWALLSQLVRVISNTDAIIAGFFIAVTLLMFWLLLTAMDGKQRPAVLARIAFVGAGSAWTAGAITLGPNAIVTMAWIALLFSLYAPTISFILQTKHTTGPPPPTPAAQYVEPIDPFDGVAGLRGCQWISSEIRTATGSERYLQVAPGESSAAFAATKVGNLASYWGVDPLAVELLDLKKGNRVLARRHDRDDVHAKTFRWPLLDHDKVDTRDPVPFGLYRDKSRCQITMRETNILVAGVTRAGKTVGVSELVAAIIKDPSAIMWIIDPKMADYSWAKGHCDLYVRGDNPAEHRMVLRRVRDEIQRRMVAADAAGVSKVAEIPPSPGGVREIPTGYLVIDEGHVVTSDPECDDLIYRIVATCLAADIHVIFVTQRPSGKLMSTDTRSQFSTRVCFRVEEKHTERMIFGDGTKINATEIPAGQRGLCYVSIDSTSPRLVRTFYLTDADRRAVASAAPLAITAAVDPLPQPIHVPVAEADGGPVRLPDGTALDGWRADLWRAIGPDPRTTQDLYFTVSASAGTTQVKDTLTRWADTGQVDKIPGRPNSWRRD